MAKRTLKKTVKEVDGWLYLLTGKRLKDMAPRAIELFGEEVMGKLMKNNTPTPDPENPYFILGCQPEYSDRLIKAHYTDLAHKYHPDTGTPGDPAMFQKVTEAYNSIMKGRHGKTDQA